MKNLKTKLLAMTLGLTGLLNGPAARAEDPAGFHGMLVVGNNKVYLSHLPMFAHALHAYQVIFEADLGPSATEIYLKSKAAPSTETVYTLAPEENFSLPARAQDLKPFKATLFKGHFERGGKPIAAIDAVKLKRVLFFRKFDKETVKPVPFTGLVFGDTKEAFLAHFITQKPDFDQVLELKQLAPELSAELSKVADLPSSAFLKVTALPATPGAKAQSNKKGLKTGTSLRVATENATQGTVKLGRSLYLETGDLSF